MRPYNMTHFTPRYGVISYWQLEWQISYKDVNQYGRRLHCFNILRLKIPHHNNSFRQRFDSLRLWSFPRRARVVYPCRRRFSSLSRWKTLPTTWIASHILEGVFNVLTLVALMAALLYLLWFILLSGSITITRGIIRLLLTQGLITPAKFLKSSSWTDGVRFFSHEFSHFCDDLYP